MQTHDAWRIRADYLEIESRAFIDGAFRDAHDGATFASVSPVDGRTLAQVARCRQADADVAVHAARRAFDAGAWRCATPRERKRVLLRWAALVREHAGDLALLETLDTGKPIGDTTAVDIPASAYCIEWFAEAIDKIGGEVAPTDPHLVGLVTREPVGVVAAIVPWNFPAMIAMWKCAPALAAGNSVVLKPSEKSPLSALRLAALAAQAGLPAGVLNVLPGFGDAGEALARHPDVDCIAFTGSTAVGRQVARCAADSNLKRAWLELGGKSPQIVLPDCADLERAARTVAHAVFYNTGQMCTAGSRLLVHRAIRDAFLARVLAIAPEYAPGDPLSPMTRMGSLIDAAQVDRVLEYIDAGRGEATLLAGGERVRTASGGLYIEPTVFDCPRADARIVREEIFGPVLAVTAFDDLDEAVTLANDTCYGLAASVWTADLATAHETARRLRAGTVWVNGYEETDDMNFPFGGFKESGNGRDNSLHALEKYTELKSTIIRLR
ncbi:aldehyde dehydrogenase [Burkholderia sp. FERM BP-3421]|jgi:gamma-glutamyl-gamma-aminobutyraldehyde dehydrogenase|uniref:aldehyde dehydrogenase n=1 Tax=Burkholderia sp. FERM BP-3421 TaxID=1494466 RepID=UPI00235E0577|nr:aldehyde dehydrogenase [Burkholderia sp. FERM BP-3421]WDD92123.1 aldehyde dehydrogenase [Burkholderia sp. FERM BP-3421]